MARYVDPDIRWVLQQIGVLQREMRIITSPAERERAEQEARVRRERQLAAQQRAVAELKAESEFYVEVKEALIAEGKSEKVAIDLINSPIKLNAQAKRLGI